MMLGNWQPGAQPDPVIGRSSRGGGGERGCPEYSC